MKPSKTYIFELVSRDGTPLKMVQTGELCSGITTEKIRDLCKADPKKYFIRTRVL